MAQSNGVGGANMNIACFAPLLRRISEDMHIRMSAAAGIEMAGKVADRTGRFSSAMVLLALAGAAGCVLSYFLKTELRVKANSNQDLQTHRFREDRSPGRSDSGTIKFYPNRTALESRPHERHGRVGNWYIVRTGLQTGPIGGLLDFPPSDGSGEPPSLNAWLWKAVFTGSR